MNATPTIKMVENDVEPAKNLNVFDNLIGQEDARRQIQFFINSHSERTPIPTLLFTGSHGLGKSFFSEKVSKALGHEFVEVNCANIPDAKALFDLFVDQVIGNTRKTILFDESHKLSQEVTTILLSALNPNRSNQNVISYKGMNFVYDFNKINIIFATTDSYRMFNPLLNRCTEVYFHPYSNDDLVEIVKSYIPEVTIDCCEESIAFACRGRARDAYLLSQNIMRYCSMNDNMTLTNDGWKAIRNIFGIYLKGLRTQEVALLRILGKEENLSVKNMAIRMGVNINNIESELEVRAKELGLIGSNSRGRYLTEDGHEYLAKINS